jgi:hypothetical protein
MTEYRYWVALFREGGESAGVERQLARCSLLDEARSKYKRNAALHPGRIVMLCDRATVLARSDRNPPYGSVRAYHALRWCGPRYAGDELHLARPVTRCNT